MRSGIDNAAITGRIDPAARGFMTRAPSAVSFSATRPPRALESSRSIQRMTVPAHDWKCRITEQPTGREAVLVACFRSWTHGSLCWNKTCFPRMVGKEGEQLFSQSTCIKEGSSQPMAAIYEENTNDVRR